MPRTLLFAALPASATLITIDFEADGNLGNDTPIEFESVDAPGVKFSTVNVDGGSLLRGNVTSAGGGQTDGISFISEECRTCLRGIVIDFDFNLSLLKEFRDVDIVRNAITIGLGYKL